LASIIAFRIFFARRQALARCYDLGLAGGKDTEPLKRLDQVSHGYHLYAVRTQPGQRDAIFRRLREAGVGANVHYRPIPSHSYYRRLLPTASTPVANALSERLLTLPLHPGMKESDVDFVLGVLDAAG
jgi:dTDP-4-amino-4,6-dideoxygalactose transaminase